MSGIQFNKHISRAVWEELHELDIDAWGFPLSACNALLRNRCYTIGDVIDLTETEIRSYIKSIQSNNPEVTHERVFQKIMDILKENNIKLPTDYEKKAIQAVLTEEDKLREEIRLLKRENLDLQMSRASGEMQNSLQKEKRKLVRELEGIEEIMENHLDVELDVPISDIYAINDPWFEDLKAADKRFSMLIRKGEEILLAIDFLEEVLDDRINYRLPTLKLWLEDVGFMEIEEVLRGWIESSLQGNKRSKYIYAPGSAQVSEKKRVKRIPLEERLDMLVNNLV